jgi:cellulose synthase (UDP-forming)
MPTPPYFTAFLHRTPPADRPLSARRRTLWQVLAGATIGLGLWYLHWRWTASLNPDAMAFSVVIVLAETMAFLGTLLFFFDIWDEGDTPRQPPPETRAEAGLEGKGDILVDIFITTYDEEVALVAPSIEAALNVTPVPGVQHKIYVLDDGNRGEMRALADRMSVGYLHRDSNRGFKAGNLTNALFRTSGDFVAICDADTQIFPTFLEHTLGYFRDPNVSWVQTPHWFYDLPEGQDWGDWLSARLGRWARPLAPLARGITGTPRLGENLFLADPVLFFDVIQRRRNRHGASFCCGAGSIHRREAIFDNALTEQGRSLGQVADLSPENNAHALLPRVDMQPFRYHVSEDIYTSIQQQTNGWRSVYHPQVEARMLSPWSASAWATQKLKYAGGTFDIMIHANPLFRRGMPWTAKLHYMATFWSYLGVIWLPLLILAPVFSLLTGLAPVKAYSLEFFLHILPVLLINELAMNVGCKGHDIHAGRILSLGTLAIQWRALLQALRGDKPHFPPTPKTPVLSGSLRHAMPNLILLGAMAASAVWGLAMMQLGSEAHSPAFVTVNLFWLLWGGLSVFRVTLPALLTPTLPDIPAQAGPIPQPQEG